ncbi:hypothetical protein Pcinc_031921 [Petrolisthes cinctipes]|uniref:Uncharacterized protein n=1 Tax=Petrolisthes cinctipes TaxID=88211 RepID=A0AAE1K1W1_PETCI|nr:hypothetical protein Pcinc_031921 [Petrolisthes cinctipes]
MNPVHPPFHTQSIHHFTPSPSTISNPVHPPFRTQSIHHFEPSPSTISNPVHPPFHTQLPTPSPPPPPPAAAPHTFLFPPSGPPLLHKGGRASKSIWIFTQVFVEELRS